jgi:hypothetical protein
MNTEMLAAVIQIITLAVQLAPTIATEAKQIIDLLNSGEDPTDDQITAIRTSLDKAHAALQAASQG